MFTYPDLQVQVTRSSNQAELKCHSSCPLAGPYVWYKNGETITEETSSSYAVDFGDEDSYSCAVKGYEAFRSPSVCEFTAQSLT